MTERRSSMGARLKNPSWKDPKLLIGVVLILASIVGVILLVMSMNKNVEVYVAKKELKYGHIVSQEDFATVPVNLGDLAGSYHVASEGTLENLQALRAIPEGELISKKALGESLPKGEQSLVLSLPIENISGLMAGDEIEIWVAERQGPQEYADPTKVVSQGILASVELHQGSLGSNSDAQVRIWLPSPDVPKILKSQSNQSHIFLVGRASSQE